jgi:hypothetical protein
MRGTMPRKMSDKRLRRKLIEANRDEIEKIVIGLQSRQLEAFELLEILCELGRGVVRRGRRV